MSCKQLLFKTAAWRVVATSITVGLVYVATEDWGEAFAVGLADTLSKTLAFFVFERCWERRRKRETKPTRDGNEGEHSGELGVELEVELDVPDVYDDEDKSVFNEGETVVETV